MAVYHFWMPYQWAWTSKLRATPSAIAWGAFMINFCFSVLLVWGAVMTVFAAFRWARQDGLTRCAVWGMGAFWVLNAGYQALFPMPLPEDFRAVGWFLLGFAAVVAFLYSVAIAVSLTATLNGPELLPEQGLSSGAPNNAQQPTGSASAASKA